MVYRGLSDQRVSWLLKNWGDKRFSPLLFRVAMTLAGRTTCGASLVVVLVDDP